MQRYLHLFILLLSALTIQPLLAETYISDVAITACRNSYEINFAKKELTNAGYKVIDININNNYNNIYYFTYYHVFLGYKTTTDPSQAITLLIFSDAEYNSRCQIKNGDFTYDMYTAKKYYQSNGNLHQGNYSSSDRIYLLYSKSNQGNLSANLYTDLKLERQSNNEAKGLPLYSEDFYMSIVSNKEILCIKKNVANLHEGNYSSKGLYLEATNHTHDLKYNGIDNDKHAYICTICKLSIIEKHQYSSTTNHADDNYHWGKCSKCGADVEKTLHTFVRSSTSLNNHSRVCYFCHKVINNEHKYSNFYPVDDDAHMCVCADTLCGFSFQVPHSWSVSDTILAPTFDDEGIVEYTCRDCSAKKRGFIPAITIEAGHNHGDPLIEDELIEEEETEEPVEQRWQDSTYIYTLTGQRIRPSEDIKQDMKSLPTGKVYIVKGKRVFLVR